MKTIKTFHLNLTCVLVFVLILAGSQVIAQDQITLKGRILDNKTNQPLPFATISIPQSMTGVISNEFGEFQYHIPENFEKSVVMITYIGYRPNQIRVSEIKSGVLTVFWMEEQTKALPEVAVSGNKGKVPASKIVDRAVRNISRNYPDMESLQYGYYRDYVRPTLNNDYVNLIEAAVVINDLGFKSFDYPETKIKLEQLRYSPDFKIDTALNLGYYGIDKLVPYADLDGDNELAILRLHDPIRNHNIRTFSWVYAFDRNFIANHNFLYESVTQVDSDTVYCIHFDKHVEFKNSQAKYDIDGKIYIAFKTYAILKLIYKVTMNSPVYSGNFFDLNLEYRNHNNKYYLNYMSLMNYFVYRDDSLDTNRTATPYYQYRELFINKIVNKPFVSIKPHEEIRKDTTLLSNKNPKGKGFWENYNYTGVTKLQE